MSDGTMTTVPHPRRGDLQVLEVIAPLVETMWRLGIDVSTSDSSHAHTVDKGGRGARFEFRDFEVFDTNQEGTRIEANTERHPVDQSMTLAERLLAMLEGVEPGISRRPWWVTGDYLLGNGTRSFLTLPENDLPLLSELLTRVEDAHTKGEGLNLGLPLSANTWYELNYGHR
jgi:hypothetical protein